MSGPTPRTFREYARLVIYRPTVLESDDDSGWGGVLVMPGVVPVRHSVFS